MKVFSIVVFCCILRSSSCGLSSRLLKESDGSAVSITSPRCLIEEALTRNEGIDSGRYNNFKPLVKENWEKHEESIRVMVNEAAYNLKFAEDVSRRIRDEVPDEAKETFEHLVAIVRLFCCRILEFTEEKVFELRPAFLSVKLERSDAQEGAGNILTSSYDLVKISEKTHGHGKDKVPSQRGMENRYLKTISWKEKLRMKIPWKIPFGRFSPPEEPRLTLDSDLFAPPLTNDKIIQGLQECFIKVETGSRQWPSTVPTWKQTFDQAIFQVMEYLYKYDFITQDQMSMFYKLEGSYPKDSLLRLTGKHISKTCTFSALYIPIIFKPQWTSGIVDSAVDYLQHSFMDLDHASQNIINHTAFSDFHISILKNLQICCWPQLESAIQYFTKDKFLNQISKWSPKAAPFTKKDKIGRHLGHLIDHFMQPDMHFQNAEGEYKVEAFGLTVHMLKYITRKMAQNQSLSPFFSFFSLDYHHFKLQLQLIIGLEEYILLFQRHEFLKVQLVTMDHRIFLKDQLENKISAIWEEIRYLKFEHLSLRLKIAKDEKMCAWKSQFIVNEYLKVYEQYLN